MIASCKLLKSCEIQLNRRSMADWQDQNEQWIEVMSALQGHSSTLTLLALRDELKFVTERRSWSTMIPVSGFRQLGALEDLEAPWSLIMGKPGALVDEQPPGFTVRSTTADFVGRPRMSDMLPPKLRSLTCAIKFWREPQGFYDEGLRSILPISAGEDTSLKIVNCVLFNWDTITPLPIDFAANKVVFDERGVRFRHAVRNLRESDIEKLQGGNTTSAPSTVRER